MNDSLNKHWNIKGHVYLPLLQLNTSAPFHSLFCTWPRELSCREVHWVVLHFQQAHLQRMLREQCQIKQSPSWKLPVVRLTIQSQLIRITLQHLYRQNSWVCNSWKTSASIPKNHWDCSFETWNRMSTSHREDKFRGKHFSQRMKELKPKSIKNVYKYHLDLCEKLILFVRHD